MDSPFDISPSLASLLRDLSAKYETADFPTGDPSWFMHQVTGRENQEAMAFIASTLSYGSRKQFMPKIQSILDWSGGEVDAWVRDGGYEDHFHKGDSRCFYRLYNIGAMYCFFTVYRQLMAEHGSLGDYVRLQTTDGQTQGATASGDGIGAVTAICRYFADHGPTAVIPKDTQSACKRVCMFLRWMVRKDSPVDLGLWSSFIDRRTLVMPLDTHVVSQSVRLGLLQTKSTSMSTARRLTERLAAVFPDDPLRGDFALFGYGVNNN